MHCYIFVGYLWLLFILVIEYVATMLMAPLLTFTSICFGERVCLGLTHLFLYRGKVRRLWYLSTIN
jgi:hypothetical protein